MDGSINFSGTLMGSIADSGGGNVDDVRVRHSQTTEYESVVNDEKIALIDLVSYVRRNELTQAIENIENSIDNVEHLIDTKQNIINYSTEEQVIGTYFGKPLYQKSMRGTFESNSTTLTLSIDSQDIITPTRFDVTIFPSNDIASSVVLNTDKNQSSYAYYRSVAGYGIIKNTGITIIRGGVDTFGNTPDAVLTVQYTKTTD